MPRLILFVWDSGVNAHMQLVDIDTLECGKVKFTWFSLLTTHTDSGLDLTTSNYCRLVQVYKEE